MVNRVRLLILAVVLIPMIIIAANLLLYDSTPIASSPNSFTSFSVDGRTFEFTYLATNQSALQKGLMDTKVTDSTTELFVFPTADYYSFWMFGVNSSLDIMWVDALPGSNGAASSSSPLTRPRATSQSPAPRTPPPRRPTS